MDEMKFQALVRRLESEERERPGVYRLRVGLLAALGYGYIGLVDGILERLRAEISDLVEVVATGGQAELIATGSRHIGKVEPLLTLIGLRRIHELNRGS